MAEDVLGHDDGAVDDDAEVDGAQGQEVGGDAAQIHEDEGEEEGERDGHGNDEGRADVVEKEREQDDHENGALDQVPHHRRHRRPDKTIAAVVVAQLDAGGQRSLEMLDLSRHALDHRIRVLALAHEHDALDEIVVMVAAQHPQPYGRADADGPDVADADGRALLGADHDVLDVAHGLHEPEPAHGHAVLALGDVATPGVGVGGGGGVQYLLEGEVVGAETGRIHGDLVLLGAAAPGHHVGHARDLAELALQDPVLKRLEVDERHGLGLEGVAVDLADHARHGAKAGLGIGG